MSKIYLHNYVYFNVTSIVLKISSYFVKIVGRYRYASQIVLKVEKIKKLYNASQNFVFYWYLRYVKIMKFIFVRISQSF